MVIDSAENDVHPCPGFVPRIDKISIACYPQATRLHSVHIVTGKISAPHRY